MKETFLKNLQIIRKSICEGNVTDGVAKLASVFVALDGEKEKEEKREILLDLVLVSIVCGDYDEAENRYDEVCALQLPNNDRKTAYDAYYQMGHAKRKHSQSLFEKIILSNPDSYEFYLLRGLAYFSDERFEHAQADISRANILSPNNILILSSLAEVCVELKEIDRAIALHEAVLNACPDFRRSLMSLGVLYFDKRRTKEAFKLFQCLVAYDPMNWFAWICLGDILATMPGRFFQALPYYSAAAVAECEMGTPWLNLAKGFVMLGRYRQAVRILDLYEKEFGKAWQNDERRFVRYLRLMCRVIINPEVWQNDELAVMFQSIKPLCDQGSFVLFQILSELASLSNADSVRKFFALHIRLFLGFVQYMQNCDKRIIEPEEALMLGTITRMFIWCGFNDEALTLLGLLGRADEPMLCDFTALLWDEYYRHHFAEASTSISQEDRHRGFMQEEGVDEILNMISSCRTEEDFQKIPLRKEWPLELGIDMIDRIPKDFTANLFDLPFENLLEKLFDCSEEHYEEEARRFWDICAALGKKYSEDQDKDCASAAGGIRNDNILPADTHDDTHDAKDPVAEQIREIYTRAQNIETDIDDEDEFPEYDILSEMISLCSAKKNISGLKIDYVFKAQNSNVIEEYMSAESFINLTGYQPLPFAVDGSAFRQFLPLMASEVSELTEATVQEFLMGFLKRYNFAFERLVSPNSIKRMVSPNVSAELKNVMRMMHFLYGVHGKEALRTDGHGIEDMAVILGGSRRENRNPYFRLALRYFASMKKLAVRGVYLPQSKLLNVHSMRYRIQDVPEFPQAAAIFKQPVPANQVNLFDLSEQFFNRAVYAFERWQETGDLHELDVLMELPDGFHFRPFEAFVSSKRSASGSDRTVSHRCSKAQLKSKMIFPHAFQPLNSDSEKSIPSKFRSIKRSVPKVKFRMHASDEISNASQMAKSLRRMQEYAKKMPISLLQTEFRDGYKAHPFLAQFRHWAEMHAEHLLHKVMKIQSLTESMHVSKLSMASWKTLEIIHQYPFLSRMYIVLARIYARLSENDKAIQAIQSGLTWEEKLYAGIGWRNPVFGGKEIEGAIEPVNVPTELSEKMDLLWPERYVFLNSDESMYHYAAADQSFAVRRRYEVSAPIFLRRIVNGDSGGAFEFYRLFRKFMTSVPALREAFFEALKKKNVFSLRDYIVDIVIGLESPMLFPLRRQLMEMVCQLYPLESTGPLGHFYCDNMQPANSLPNAAFSYLYSTYNDKEDDASHSLVTLGCLLYDMGFMGEAVEYLRRATKLKICVPMAFLTLGCACIELQQYSEAVSYLTRGKAIDPKSDRFPYNLSLAYIEMNRLDDAEREAKEGIALSAYPVDLNMQLVRVYVKQNRDIEALPLCQYVAREDPDLFLNAMKTDEFSVFSKKNAVKKIISECSYTNPIHPNDDK